VVYCDWPRLWSPLPREYGYGQACCHDKVVSPPRPGIAPADAGIKQFTADAGSTVRSRRTIRRGRRVAQRKEPTSQWQAGRAAGAQVGDAFIFFRGTGPTGNNFDCAPAVQEASVKSVERCRPAGREAPMLHATDNYPQTSLPADYGMKPCVRADWPRCPGGLCADLCFIR